MVLPILGLLGAAALSPHYANYNRRAKGRALENDMAKAGVDPASSSRRDLAQFGMNSGALNFGQGMDVLTGQQSFDESVRQFNTQEARRQRGQDHQIFMDSISSNATMPDLSGLDMGDLDPGALLAAHSNMESGNRYFDDAGAPILGPVIESGIQAGDQAIGRYQVMPNTLKMWSQEVFGRDVSPEEFANSPELQDQLYTEKFLKVAQTEGIANALSKWHSGLSYEEARQKGIRDQNMSTVNYVDKVMKQYQRNAAQNEEVRLNAEMHDFDPQAYADMNSTQSATLKAHKRQQLLERMGNQAAIDMGNAPDPAVAQETAENTAVAAALGEHSRAYQNTETVLEGLNEVGRLVNVGADATAASNAVERAGMELQAQWQKIVYPDNEPPESVIEQLNDVFRDPGKAMTENREATLRFFRVLQAEIEQARQYDQVKALAETGNLDASRMLLGMDRALPWAQRQRILSGKDIPEGTVEGASGG